MDETQERFAHGMREVAKQIHDAIAREHQAEADLKRIFARKQIEAQAAGHKAANAQTREADLDDEVYAARIELGVAKAEVSALKVHAKAIEIAFEQWRTNKASERMDRRAYGA